MLTAGAVSGGFNARLRPEMAICCVRCKEGAYDIVVVDEQFGKSPSVLEVYSTVFTTGEDDCMSVAKGGRIQEEVLSPVRGMRGA